jgi:hypothetical protein
VFGGTFILHWDTMGVFYFLRVALNITIQGIKKSA